MVCLSTGRPVRGVRPLHHWLPEDRHEPGQSGGPQPEVSPELCPVEERISGTGQRSGGGGGKQRSGKEPAVCRTSRPADGGGTPPVPRHFLSTRSGHDGNQGIIFGAGGRLD